jgi:hypothetical protein
MRLAKKLEKREKAIIRNKRRNICFKILNKNQRMCRFRESKCYENF